MLRELSIRNFAIIDDLRISFSEGLTILSGETGAGKSIIINAVNLLLGSRASASLIRTGSESAELEALFDIPPESDTSRILLEHGYDDSDELLIRRIISSNDRHRIYINGRLSTITILNTITENLACISGQHAHQTLLRENQHLLILDQFGDHVPLRDKISATYQQIAPLIAHLSELEKKRERQREQIERLRFQKNEIEAAEISRGEDASIEKELMRLKNGEAIYQTVYQAVEDLYSAENSVMDRLVETKKRLEKSGQIDSQLSSHVNNIETMTFQLEDTVSSLRNYLNRMELDPAIQEQKASRLHTIQKIKRKYGNGNLEGVFAHLESVNRELHHIEHLDESIAETEQRLADLHTELSGLVIELSEKRKIASEELSQRAEQELATLQMAHTRFQVCVQSYPATDKTSPFLRIGDQAIRETGLDRVQFMIAPNVGESLKPLANIASGGELSRVILALKVMIARAESVGTIVFDEVDAGIGGSVAEKVGNKLSELAAYHQVICITHLAQIAKFGKHHFRIAKHISDGRTRTTIDPLDDADRVEEIARMIGGITITPATLDHAKELLGIPK